MRNFDLEEIFSNILNVFAVFICAFLVIVCIAIPIIFTFGFDNVIAYHFNKSTCDVLVNQQEVYSGFCHFVEVEPVGEYGNSKRVIIYRDSRRWRPKQVYVSDDVEIKEME